MRRRIADAYDGLARTGGQSGAAPALEVSRLLAGNAAEVEHVSPYFAVSAWNAIVSRLALAGSFSSEDQAAAARGMFLEVPIGEDGLFRRVTVGGFFRDGSPLEIRASVLSPGEGASTDASRIVVIQTNAVLQGRQGQIDQNRGRFISLDENLSYLLLIFPDGVLVSHDNLENDSFAARLETGGQSAMNVINLSDYILKDDSTANDEAVEKPLMSIWSDEDEDATMRFAAGLNLYLYRLAAGQLDEARALLTRLEKDADDSLDDSFFAVIEGEAPAMLEMMEILAER
jgi:hypothetical protein